MHTKFWSENLKLRDKSADTGVRGNIILKRILGKLSGKLWTGFSCLKTVIPVAWFS
jgi:hypothetical protein